MFYYRFDILKLIVVPIDINYYPCTQHFCFMSLLFKGYNQTTTARSSKCLIKTVKGYLADHASTTIDIIHLHCTSAVTKALYVPNILLDLHTYDPLSLSCALRTVSTASLLIGLLRSEILNHWNVGCGFPVAVHVVVIVFPSSTTIEFGVAYTNVGGSENSFKTYIKVSVMGNK